MNLAQLMFITEFWEKHGVCSLLTERFGTTETEIRGISRSFVNKAVYSCRYKLTENEKKGIKTDSYGYLALYIKKLIKSGNKNAVIYTEKSEFGKYSTTLSLKLGDETSKNHGVTTIDDNNPNKISIAVNILPREVKPILDSLESNTIPYEYITMLMNEIKSHFVHEITHLFQRKAGRLDTETADKTNKMEEYQAFNEIQHYFYLLQEHECDARVIQAIKLFLDKTNYDPKKEDKGFRNESCFDILFDLIIKSLRNKRLESNVHLDNNLSPLENAVRFGSTPDRFFLVWFYWCFIDKNPKFQHYIFPGGTPHPPERIDLEIIENNKKNIDEFLRSIDKKDIEKLGAIILKETLIRFKESVFSLFDDNEEYLESIKKLLG